LKGGFGEFYEVCPNSSNLSLYKNNTLSKMLKKKKKKKKSISPSNTKKVDITILFFDKKNSLKKRVPNKLKRIITFPIQL